MKITTKSSKKKVAVVVAALSATLTFGGALAYLTDHDAKNNRFAFQQASDASGSGLITLVEADWESDTTGTGTVKGKQYASQGILPGETLTKDPTITINSWLAEAAANGRNTPNLNLFMRVLVPQVDVTGDGSADELFTYTSNGDWALMGAKEVLTYADEPGEGELKSDAEHPAGSYVAYRYCYGTTSALKVAGAGSTVPSLFNSVTYTKDATVAPSADQHIIVDAYAIQADNLTGTDSTTAAGVYHMASGDTVTSA